MIEFTRMDRVQLLFTLQVFTLINNIFTLINNIRISIKRESFLKAQKMVSSPREHVTFVGWVEKGNPAPP